MRLMKEVPQWFPGKQNGQIVRVNYTLPISFKPSTRIQDNNDHPVVASGLPLFPGGKNAFSHYILHNLKYPVKAEEKGIQGRVVVGFDVETDGSITHVRVVKSAHKLLDAEALRLVKSMPKWIPAKENGVLVVSNYNLPIFF